MSYDVRAKIVVDAWVHVNADSAKEASVQAHMAAPGEWAVLHNDECKVLEVLEIVPGGMDYEPDKVYDNLH